MIYQYECPGDGEIIEIERSIKDKDREYYCPVCKAILRRVYNSNPVHFRGSGFYSTDKA